MADPVSDIWQFSDPTFPPYGRKAVDPPHSARQRNARQDQPRTLPALPHSARQQDARHEQHDPVGRRAHGAMFQARDAPLRGATSIFHSEGQEEFILPTNMDVAVKDTVSLLAVENWHEHPTKDGGPYESTLLECESRLRRLNRLSKKLKPPNACITAVVCDLLLSTMSTLPLVLRNICEGLMKYILDSVYSQTQLDHTDLAQLKELVSERMERAPWFAVARKYQDQLEVYEDKVFAMQRLVDEHLRRRKSVLAFIIRLQKEERLELQKWLFVYWRLVSSNKRERIDKLTKILQAAPSSPCAFFLLWKLFITQNRLALAKNSCGVINVEANNITSRITAIELANEDSQKELAKSLEIAAALKVDCAHAEEERVRLQQLWDSTQPELLLSVLVELLGVFFKLLAQAARFSGMEVRQRLANCDVSVLLQGLPWKRSTEPPYAPFLDASCEVILLRWLNIALGKARQAAAELLKAQPPPSAIERGWLEIVEKQGECTNLGNDLSDGVALCMLISVLKAEQDGKTMCPTDLHMLEERDFTMRAASFFPLLSSFAPEFRTKCLLAPVDIVEANTSLTLCLLAECFLKAPLLPQAAEAQGMQVAGICDPELETVIATMEVCARRAERDAFEDPSPLLHGGEDYHVLATLSAEELLLRWVNTVISESYGRRIENFGSDLQDGAALSCLLQIVASDVTPKEWSIGEEDHPTSDHLLEDITAVASRCTDFELLTADAIAEGHADVLAVFLAQLFLKRSNLGVRQGSLMCMHLELLETTCREGVTVLANPGNTKSVMAFCSRLSATWDAVTIALTAVQEATRSMQGLQSCLRSFSGETLACRTYGRPRIMLDAKEARELLQYSTLTRSRQSYLANHGDSNAVHRLEELLRKQFRLLRDIFKFYATSTDSNFGITLDGLLRLYRECKLRSKDLAPHHLEVIFYDQIDHSMVHAPSDAFLSPQNFVEVLLEFATLKYGNVMISLPDQLWHLIENHLKPYACQDQENIFQRMAYDAKVRGVLEKHDKELRIIFQIYAMADVSSGEAMQRVNTMNIKEFQLLLVNCELLDETLTESAVQQIFEGIQQSGDGEVADSNFSEEDAEEKGGDDESRASGNAAGTTATDGAVDDGIDDDDELAFSEFLDGLVAVAAYKQPDPFTPFWVRVNSFLLSMFGALRRHWSRKRLSPQVDLMLNALQKKLRGND